MRAEHLRMWFCVETQEKDPELRNWEKVVAIIQAEFREGELVESCAWQTVVMISKGVGKNIRGIGLVEVLWKAISRIFNLRISSSIHFHDSLRVFRAVRGTGTSTLEAELLQKLVSMKETFPHSIFIDLQKSYVTLDRECCLDILVGYGVGPRTICLLWTYWAQLHMVAKVGGHYRPVLQIHRGLIHGGPLSPMIFNMVIEAVIRNWMTVLGGLSRAPARA